MVDATTITPADFTDPRLTFTATDTVAIDHYEVDVNGSGFTIALSGVDLSTIGTISAVTLNVVTVRVYDTAGNFTDTIMQFYPIVTITSSIVISNAAIPAATIGIVVTGPNDITAVTAEYNNVAVGITCPDLANPADDTIQCTLDNPLTVSGTLEVFGEDSNGPGSVSSQQYIIETTNPVITPSTPTVISQATITDSSFVITDAYGISIVTFTGVANTLACIPVVPTAAVSTTCTGSITASGTLSVDVTDTAGNTASVTEDYIVDNAAPTISALTPVAGLYNSAQAITFTVQDTNAGIVPGDVVIT